MGALPALPKPAKRSGYAAEMALCTVSGLLRHNPGFVKRYEGKDMTIEMYEPQA